MLFFLNLVGFTTSRIIFLKRAMFHCSFLALLLAFHYILHLPDQYNKCLNLRALSIFGLLDCPLLLFSLLSGFSNVGPYFRPHILVSGSCLNFRQSPAPDHINHFGGFSFN